MEQQLVFNSMEQRGLISPNLPSDDSEVRKWCKKRGKARPGLVFFLAAIDIYHQ